LNISHWILVHNLPIASWLVYILNTRCDLVLQFTTWPSFELCCYGNPYIYETLLSYRTDRIPHHLSHEITIWASHIVKSWTGPEKSPEHEIILLLRITTRERGLDDGDAGERGSWWDAVYVWPWGYLRSVIVLGKVYLKMYLVFLFVRTILGYIDIAYLSRA